jgi:hypothetical protein
MKDALRFLGYITIVLLPILLAGRITRSTTFGNEE